MTSKSPFATDKKQLRNVLTNSIQGVWKGDGLDVFPTPHGTAETAYVETMTFGEIFETVNPGGPNNSQTLIGIHYYTKLDNKKTKVPMHQETGYWLFDVDKGEFIKAIAIPRGITILAGGVFMPILLQGASFETLISASAENSSNIFGISNATFLEQIAPTTKFTTQIQLRNDTLTYFESSILRIQGQLLDHTDTANLIKQ